MVRLQLEYIRMIHEVVSSLALSGYKTITYLNVYRFCDIKISIICLYNVLNETSNVRLTDYFSLVSYLKIYCDGTRTSGI